MSDRVRTAVRVEGVVQGVGFRPFVYSLATRLGLADWSATTSTACSPKSRAAPEAVREFLVLLEQQAPPLAKIERVTTSNLSA